MPVIPYSAIILFNNSSSSAKISNNHSDDTFLQGWTTSPTGRGTAEIIWSCHFTVFLCCWSILCVNVPPPSWGLWRRVHAKFIAALMSGFGPEFTFQLALGQWSSARRSVAVFRKSGYLGWTMRHAFLADMGGFVLHPSDWDVGFPLNAKQLHYLVTHGYVSYEDVRLPKDIIADKNKADGVVRFITLCQILWFSVNCFGRLAQKLTITTMELSVLSYIMCTVGTSLLWVFKPMDVGSAIVLVPNTPLRDILTKAGDIAKEPYRCTPLDFVGRDLSSWFLHWTYWMNVVRQMRVLFTVKRGPIEKIPDDNFPPLSRRAMFILFLFQTTYGGVYLSGWNLHFPTPVEQLLWRVITVCTMSAICFYWPMDLYAFYLHNHVKSRLRSWTGTRDKGTEAAPVLEKLVKKRHRNLAARLRNNSSLFDQAMDIPLKAVFPMGALAFCYGFSRVYIILEGWLSMRAQPASAYQTVDWALFWPHL